MSIPIASFPGATAGTTSYRLNNLGQTVGFFADSVGQHGFLYTTSTGTYETLDVPGSYASLAVAMNDAGTITFEWVSPGFDYSGAMLSNGQYTILNVPGMLQSKARGINGFGTIVLNAQATSGVWHGFIYRVDVANSASTYSFGISSQSMVVGGYNPSGNPASEIGFGGRF